MKKIYLFTLFIFAYLTVSAQLFVSSDSEIYVSSSSTLYTNENFVNQGTLSLETGGTANTTFDGDYLNTDGTVNFNDNAFRIGSGDTTRSIDDVNLEFATAGETVDFMIVNKDGGTATGASSTLEIIESLTMQNGNLDAEDEIILISNAANTAIVEQSDQNATASVTVQRFFPGKRAFRFVSPSVNSSLSISENWQEGATAWNDSSVENGFGIHITGLGELPGSGHSSTPGDGDQFQGLDWQPSGNPSMFMFNGTIQDWLPVLETNVAALNAQLPFLTMVRGARVTGGVAFDITLNSTPATDATLRAKGSLLFGNQSAPLNSGAGNYSFVANPYHSQVDYNALTKNELTSFVYYWDPNINTRGGYVSWDSSTNVNSILGGGTGSSAINQFIQPGQAFLVQNVSSPTGAPSLQFTEANKDNTNSQTAVFSSENLSSLSVNLKTDVEGELITADGIIMVFDPNYSNDITDEDARRFFNEDETLSFVEASELLMFDKRPEPQDEKTIPLNVQNYRNSLYEFTIVKQNTSVDVYLEDTYLDIIEPITDNYSYSFTVDETVPETLNAGRFQLLFNPENLNTQDFELAGISVYPNPAINILNIDLGNNYSRFDQLELYDVQGRLVSQTNLNQELQTTQMNVGDLSSGVYILKVSSKDEQISAKVILD